MLNISLVFFCISLASFIDDDTSLQTLHDFTVQRRHPPLLYSLEESDRILQAYRQGYDDDLKKCYDIQKENKLNEYRRGSYLNKDSIVEFLKAIGVDNMGWNVGEIDPDLALAFMESFFQELQQKEDPYDIAKTGIYLYTLQREKGGPYRIMNNALQRVQFKRFDGALSYVLTSLYRLSNDYSEYKAKPGVYYRGMKTMDANILRPLQQIGYRFTFPGLTSTSLSLDVARDFQKTQEEDEHPGSTSVLFVITIPNTLEAKYHCALVKEFSYYSDEDEALFAPFHEFRVTDYIRHKPRELLGQATIHLELVGDRSGVAYNYNKCSLTPNQLSEMAAKETPVKKPTKEEFEWWTKDIQETYIEMYGHPYPLKNKT